MRVLLNTKPLIFKKTGIGYYVTNIRRELLQAGIDVVPTVDETAQGLFSSLSEVSSRMRGMAGRFYPSFVKSLGDLLISSFSVRSSGDRSFDIYHETSVERMPAVTSGAVANLYDLLFVHYPVLLPAAIAETARPDMAANMKRADRVIVNTQFIGDEAADILSVPAAKIDVIPLAPSAAYYRSDRAASRERVRRFTEREYVLCVGTVEPRKNLKTLIRAFRDVVFRDDLSLVIAGGFGWNYDDIVAYAPELGIRESVVFTGYLDEETMNDLYNCAAVVVYPSLYEGFGLPPLEAMACGAPLIISDIPALREVAGDAAAFFKASDHEELKQVIETVLSDTARRASLSEKGLERVKLYSWKRTAEETILTYQKVINR